MQTYLNYKINVLVDFGLTNKTKLKKHLKSVLSNCNDANYQTRLDNACRQLLNNFFDGDKTFCK